MNKIDHYVSAQHNIVKALGDTDYPVSKSELLAKLGDKPIKVDYEKTIPFSSILEELPQDEFPNACALFNSITCVLIP
jgi:Family of unknown function (DUF5785)